MATPAAPTGLPILALVTLAAAGFITMMAEAMPVGLLLDIAEGLDVNEAQAGMLVAVFALGTAGAAVPLTALTRTLPRKPLLLGLMAVFLATTAVTAYSGNFAIIMAARLLGGMSAGVVWAMLAGYAVALAPADKQGRAMSIAMAGTPIALALGIPAATFIGAHLGWRGAFAVMVWATLAMIGIMFLVLPRVDGEDRRQRRAVADVLMLPGMRVVVLATFVFALSHNIAYTYLAPVLQLSSQENNIQWVQLAFGATAAIGLYVIGATVDNSLKILISRSSALLAISLAGLALGAGFGPLVWGIMLVWGAAFGGTPTLLQTASALNSGPSRDIGQALIVMAWNSAVALAGVVGGVILVSQNVRFMLWVACGLSVIVFVLVTVGSRAFWSQRDRTRHSQVDVAREPAASGDAPPGVPAPAAAPAVAGAGPTIRRRTVESPAGGPAAYPGEAAPVPSVAASSTPVPGGAPSYVAGGHLSTQDTHLPTPGTDVDHVIDVREGQTPSAVPTPTGQHGADAPFSGYARGRRGMHAATSDDPLPVPSPASRAYDGPRYGNPPTGQIPVAAPSAHDLSSPYQDMPLASPDASFPPAPHATAPVEGARMRGRHSSHGQAPAPSYDQTAPLDVAGAMGATPVPGAMGVGTPITGAMSQGATYSPSQPPHAAPPAYGAAGAGVRGATAPLPALPTGPPTGGVSVGSARDKAPELSTGMLLRLEETLSKRVIGQDKAISVIASALRRFRLQDDGHATPLASILLAGPPGVGRTELIYALAESLYGSGEAVVRVQLGQMQGHSLRAALLGGEGRPGVLTQHLASKGNAVIVLDNPEHGPHDTAEVLTEMLTRARVTQPGGAGADIRGCMVAITRTYSNQPWIDTSAVQRESAEEALNSLAYHVGVDVARALDDVAPLVSLTTGALAEQVVRRARQLVQERGGRLASVQVSAEAQQWLVRKSLRYNAGVQGLVDITDTELRPRLNAAIEGSYAGDPRPILVDVDHGSNSLTAVRVAS